MNLFETINTRRSIRKFSNRKISKDEMYKAFDAALKAPNSSNTQTWNFYWVHNPENKNKLIEACLSQSAARTAAELVVVTADYKLWRRSQKDLIDYTERVNAPKSVKLYYSKLIPLMYSPGIFNILGYLKKWAFFFIGFFRPIMRGPATSKEMQEVAVKSAALACQNFVLAMTAQGYQTCMMEGFDEYRVKRLLKLKCSEKVVMVIACGEEGERGRWGEQFRIDSKLVIKEF